MKNQMKVRKCKKFRPKLINSVETTLTDHRSVAFVSI